MYSNRSKPTSCLTCRRRRKKCDRTEPRCERCLKGGFECLGYSNRESRAIVHRADPHVPVVAFPLAVSAKSARSEAIEDLSGTPRNDRTLNDTDINYDPVPSILGTGLRYMATKSTHLTNDAQTVARALEDFNRSWPQNQAQLTYRQRSSFHQFQSTESSIEITSDTRNTMHRLVELIGFLHASIPPSVVSTQTIKEARFVHTINEYQLQRASCWFMKPPAHVHRPMVNRLKSSNMMICTVYLGVKLFQELNQDASNTALRGYISWISNIEQIFTGNSDNNLSLKDVADRLMAQLELVFLGFVAIGSSLGYNLLRRTLPGFLRLVAANPNLVVEHPNGNLLVSFPHTFGALQNELKRFILYDTTTALVLGVSPLVEYDYYGDCNPTSHGFQWVHGVPVPLVEVISQVNSWRAGSRATPLSDWQTLERRVVAWQVQPLVTEDEPVGNVARLAVQEGWRHVALIYIYMGMCGVSSHDPRVQASITQIIKLGESVNSLSIGIHMLMHYVVAGLGARYEQHRSIIRERLLSLRGKRVWLFRGPEFRRVLDHLWHSVGAGGAPVTWDDYVRSRRKKCDLTKPHCERCLKGGFECLGYSTRESRPAIYRTDDRVWASESQATTPFVPTQAASSKTLMDPVTTAVSRDGRHPNPIDMDYASAPSIIGTGLRYMAGRPLSDGRDTGRSLEAFNRTWVQDQIHLVPYQRSSSYRASSSEASPETTSVALPTTRHMAERVGILCASIPPSVVSSQTIGEARFINIINEYQSHRVNCWFMPPPSQVRGPMINQLKSSKMMIWAVHLGLKLFQELNRNPDDTQAEGYMGWIGKLEHRITVASNSPSLGDTANRLMVQLELTFIGFVTIGVALGYNLLRRALPGFLRLVAANPDLITEYPNGSLLVSFPHILGMPQQELNLFILYDAATAFALGVPSLVEYSYDGKCDPTSHGYQCAHGVPVPLTEIISQVNSWRAGSRTILDDWETLEGRALAWQGLPLPIEDDDVSVNVARLAVQESWRYVTLVYVYMGMCGVSSHDPRVQASIAQIIRLEASVPNISIGMHMLMHYVVVGLGARDEQQRSIIRERLLSLKGRRVWLFRGPEFSRVLDHLWSGVGAGGAPVTWDDYVRSRCAVLPI